MNAISVATSRLFPDDRLAKDSLTGDLSTQKICSGTKI